MIEGKNGVFYGTTSGGGTNGGGTVFAVTASGQFTNLVSFSGSNDYPCGSLAPGPDGNFYGTTTGGGASDLGAVFKVSPEGELTIMASFTSNSGGNSQSGLVNGPDGNFYGATQSDGRYGYGTVFRMTPAGKITTLHSFDGKDGDGPSSFVRGEDGNFYGTTYSTVFRMTPTGSITTLVRPGGSDAPTLIRGTDGNFYGTTAVGGEFGDGTAFKLSPTGLLTILASFGGVTNAGAGPNGGLVEGKNGDFYGTTIAGGAGYGGTIFKMTTRGDVTALASFNQDPEFAQKGTAPLSLIQGADGNLYGVTYSGGTPHDGYTSGYGTIFKMMPGGHFTTLVSFEGTNGANPYTLVQGRHGDFYGITQGRLLSPYSGTATVFKFTPAEGLSTLFFFEGTNGTYPASFLQGKDGNFYGTTSGNGSNVCATIFKLTPSGTLTNLVQFDATNGFTPGALAEGADGNLYCAMEFDWSTNLNEGAIYRITPAGNVLRLVTFNGGDGSSPMGLLLLPNGKLYGTTYSGGPNGGGTVFSLGSASYECVFYQTNDIAPESSGFIRLTLSLDLKFTGILSITGQNHSISGRFDSETLSSMVKIKRSGAPILLVNMQLLSSGDTITGAVSDGSWTAQLIGKSVN